MLLLEAKRAAGGVERRVLDAESAFLDGGLCSEPSVLGNGNGISRRSQVMMRQAQHHKKNCMITLQHGPLVLAESFNRTRWTSSGLRAPHKRRMGPRARGHLS